MNLTMSTKARKSLAMYTSWDAASLSETSGGMWHVPNSGPSFKIRTAPERRKEAIEQARKFWTNRKYLLVRV